MDTTNLNTEDRHTDLPQSRPAPPVPPEMSPRPKQPAPSAKKRKDALTTISNVLSTVFSPILTPTYGYAILLLTTPLSQLPASWQWISLGVIFCITAVAPLANIIFLIRIGVVSDPAIVNPKERLIPYIVTTISYVLAAVFLWRLPAWLPGFFIGAAVASFVDSLINLRWKISAHATAMGGLCSLLIYIGINNIATVLIIPWISNAILLSGAVASARLYMQRHTPAQVYAGWLLGAAATYLAMTLL